MNKKKSIALGASVGVAGLVAGGVLATTASANADDTSPRVSYGATGEAPPGARDAGPGNGNTDPSKPMRSDEKLLTGATKDKVTAAVWAKYPDATIQRVETDSEGVYEAHIVNDGSMLTVQVGEDFTITGTQSGPGGHGGPGGDGGPGRHGDHDGDGGPGGAGEAPPTGTAPGGTAPSGTASEGATSS